MYHYELTWYGWMLIGAGIGLYLHCHHARHVVHWLLVKLLDGLIWILHRTDPLYDELDDAEGVVPCPEVKGEQQAIKRIMNKAKRVLGGAT